MGQGEPLHNYDAVIQAARVLAHPCGGRVSAKAISISTVGLVPRIHQFATEGHAFRLVISLTSAIPETREGLLPVAGRWSLQELADAMRALHRAQRRRITVAWVLMGGVNTQPEEALALQALLPDVPLRINLIDVNDARPGGFVRATDAERGAFVDALQVLRMPVVRRYSVGAARHSACGMLAAERELSP
jgi:23S rRNA (adenine2503-C2)-methyltransferase